jgi:hypothetical protein
MPDESSPEGLTDFQVEVARVFFGLAESEGFLLAGGAALVAQALTDRPTQDLDFFAGPDSGDVVVARDAFETAVQERGWSVRRVRDGVTFCRLVVSGSDSLVVDLALDTPPSRPPTASFIGPTFDLEELAGRKTLALFDRAEARDFTDVYALVQRYGKELLLARAPLKSTWGSTWRSSRRCSERCPASRTANSPSPVTECRNFDRSSRAGPSSWSTTSLVDHPLWIGCPWRCP